MPDEKFHMVMWEIQPSSTTTKMLQRDMPVGPADSRWRYSILTWEQPLTLETNERCDFSIVIGTNGTDFRILLWHTFP